MFAYTQIHRGDPLLKFKIYYTSSRNVAEAIALAIGKVVGVTPERLNPAYMPDSVDLMFLGYDGSRSNQVVQDFIQTLKPSRVRCAALFNTNSTESMKAVTRMREALEAKGIQVLPDAYVCPSRPFQKDLEDFDQDAVLRFAAASVNFIRMKG